jgi:hypothetical protein
MSVHVQAGTLIVTSAPLNGSGQTAFNLSAEGDLDWAKWGSFNRFDYDHKAGVAPQIGNFTLTGGIGNYGGAAANCSWVDGSVDQVVAGTATGVYVYGLGNGYQWNIPASPTPVVLHLYVSSYITPAQLTFTLSDGSTPAVTTNLASGAAERYTVTFAANSAGQTLTVNYVTTTDAGNIALMAASLSSAASLPLSVPQPQLSAGNVLAAGSTFNLLANPTGVAASGATLNHFQWQVSLNGEPYVDIPGGTKNPFRTTAGSAGSYNYRVVVTNSVLGGLAVTSAPAALTVTTPTSALGAFGEVIPAPVPPDTTVLDIDLTAEGVIDWAHWGLVDPADFDNKNATIGNYTQIGSDAPVPFTSGVSFSWTDGSTANPAIAATTSGVGFTVGNGFEFALPAATTNRLANVYVGVNGAQLHVEASMSDNSAPLFSDDPSTTSGVLRYTFAFSAATPGKSLRVRLKETARTSDNGSISLLAATLQPVAPLSVSALVVEPGTAVLENQPMVISVAPLQPQGVGPFSYVWQRDMGTGYENLPDTGRSASFLAGSTLGTESCRVVITGMQGSITSAPVVITRSAPTGVIKLLTLETAVVGANLTEEGSLDWSHWGLADASSFNQKATGESLIGNFIPFGPSASTVGYSSGVTYRWTDGIPTASAVNNNGIYRFPAGNGFELQVAAAQTNRILHVYLGSYQTVAHVEAFLSDNSAVKLVDESLPWGGNGKYNIQFAAGSPGQTLTFRFWFNAGGNVTLSAASLEGVPTLVVGTPTIGPASSVPAGSSVTLDAQGANGMPPLHYLWQVNDGSGFFDIPNSDNAHLATSAGALGGKSYRVVVSDITGSVTSAPVALTVTAASSTLIGSSVNVDGQTIDLSAEGSLDWAHWGNGGILGYEQKAPLAALISPYSIIGTGPVYGYGGGVAFSWTNGTPTPTLLTGAGIYINGAGNGFALEVPASTSERVFSFYSGVFMSTLHVEAAMSDNSAPIFIDESFSGWASTVRRYSIRYSSPNDGAVLKVRFWDLIGANITLVAASLNNYVPPVSLQAQPVGDGQLRVIWAAGKLLEAPAVNGPWTTNTATSPYTFTPSGVQKYFRAIVQ